MSELHYLSATEMLAAFNAKTLSPVEVMDSIITRAEAIGSTVNPFADTYFEQALANARRSEKRFQRGGRLRRLEGIPLAVKDASAIKGTRTTVGSLMNADKLDTTTDPSIERLLRAGAIVFAKTTCPEFCWLFTCHSRMWGVTRNPWRLDITPGGSSGGSAAALAAGATTVATGSDSTGSIRQPAAQCGVVGYKPPYGRNPLDADSSFDPYVHVGPMTRTVDDAILMQNVMSGPHPLDHNSTHQRIRLKPTESPDLRGCRIAFSRDLGHYEIDPDVTRESQQTLDALVSLGAEVDIIEVDWASEAIRLAHGAEEFVFAGRLNAAAESHGELLSDYVGELIETANAVTVDDYRQCFTVAGQVWRDHLGPLFKDYDAFLCPTVSCPEVPAAGWQKTPITVNGKTLTDTDTAMTVLFNMFNRCPALCVPSGFTDGGLPTGIQIVTAPYDDKMAFKVAASIEATRPWLDCPERRPRPATFLPSNR